MECYTFLRNIQDLLSDGRTPHERRFGMPFDGPVIPFGAMVEHHTTSAKDQSWLRQFGANVLSGIFLGCALYVGRIWKGDIPVADIEELEQMDASELHARRFNAKGVLTHMNGDHFIFQVADGTVKTWRKSTSETIHPLDSGIALDEEKNKDSSNRRNSSRGAPTSFQLRNSLVDVAEHQASTLLPSLALSQLR